MLRRAPEALDRLQKGHHGAPLRACHMLIRGVPAELPDVRLGCPVTSASPASSQQPAVVRWGDSQSQEFDAVIFATHSDTTLSLLGDAAPKVSFPSRSKQGFAPLGSQSSASGRDQHPVRRSYVSCTGWQTGCQNLSRLYGAGT